MPIYTSILSASQGAILSGSTYLSGSLYVSGSTQISGSFSILSGSTGDGPVMDFTRIKTAIDDGDRLGSVQWIGDDASHPGVGAELRVTATRAWTSDKLTSAKVEFFAVDENNNYPAGPAKLVISASSPPNDSQKAQAGLVSAQGSVGINNDLVVYGSGSVIGALQVGEPTPNNFWPANQSANALIPYQKFRVSNRWGDVQMALDMKDNATSGYTFTQGSDGRPESTWGWFWSGTDAKTRLSFRAADDAQENGHLVLPYPGSDNPVRIGGGGPQPSGQDGAGTLIVSSSNLTKPSWVKISAIGPNDGTFNSNHRPMLSFIHREASETTNNDGNWTMGVTHKRTGINDSLNSFCIASPSQNKSDPNQLLWYRAFTILQGGVDTRIGIGAPNAITNNENYHTNWASPIPSASLHVENSNDAPNGKDVAGVGVAVTDSQLFIRNNDGDPGRMAGITFDISTDKDPTKFSGKLTFAKVDGASAAEHAAYASIGLNDGYTGTATSTYNVRDRVRIDNQGGIIFISGSYPQSAPVGFPGNEQSDYSITSPLAPSGSLTLISLYNGNPSYIGGGTAGWVGMKTQPTINLVSQASANPGSRGSIVAQDHLGRIAWWSADANFSTFVKKSRQVGAYIEGVAAADHSDTNMSPTWVDVYTRGVTQTSPVRRIRVSSSSVRFSGEVDVESGIIKQLGAPRLTMDGDGITVAGALKVTGNVIKASDGGSTITMDTSDNVTIAGDLTVGGNDIKDSGGNIFIASDGSGNVNGLGIITTPTTTFRSATTSFHPEIHLESTDTTTGDAAELHFSRYDDAVLQVGDKLGEIYFNGTETNNNSYFQAAAIEGQVGVGTWTDSSSQPGRLSFYTVADGASSQTERLRIDSDGTVSTQNSGDLTVAGASTFVGDLVLSGGIRTGPSVHLNAGTGNYTDNWIKIAEGYDPQTSDTIAGTLLVTMVGYEQTAGYSKDFTMLINARWTKKNPSPGYYDDGTTITCEALMESPRPEQANSPTWSGLKGFNPSTDLLMRSDDAGNIEIWIKGVGNLAYRSEVHVAQLAGTTNDAYSRAGWTTPKTETSEWTGTTPVGVWADDIFGNWMTKVSGTSYSPGGIIGFWSDNPASIASTGAPGTTYIYMKDADDSPDSQFAVTFNAPPSGKVKITLGVQISPYSATASTQHLYMAYTTVNGASPPSAQAGSEVLVMTVPSEMDDWKSSMHQVTWIAEGLTWGSSYTYYFLVKESNLNDFVMYWGGGDGGAGPGFVEVVALPA